jgi:hypothetical protein
MEPAVGDTSRILVRDIEQENSLLWEKLTHMDLKLKKRKARKIAMKKAHLEDLRSRDRRELILVSILVTCFLVFSVCVVMLKH